MSHPNNMQEKNGPKARITAHIRRNRLEKMVLSGVRSHEELANAFGVSTACISQDMKLLQKSLVERDWEDTNSERCFRVAQLENVMLLSMNAFNRSKQDSEEFTIQERNCNSCIDGFVKKKKALEPVKGCVYLATNSENGMQYVGKSTETMDMRRTRHIAAARRESPENQLFYEAIREFGQSAFKWETVFRSFDNEALRKMEISTIAELGTLVPGGYNKTKGGEGGTRAKASDDDFQAQVCLECNGKGTIIVETTKVSGHPGDVAYLKMIKECIVEIGKFKSLFPMTGRGGVSASSIVTEAHKLPDGTIKTKIQEMYIEADSELIISAMAVIDELQTGLKKGTVKMIKGHEKTKAKEVIDV